MKLQFIGADHEVTGSCQMCIRDSYLSEGAARLQQGTYPDCILPCAKVHFRLRV